MPTFTSKQQSKKNTKKRTTTSRDPNSQSSTLKIRTITTAITTQPIQSSKLEIAYKVTILLLLISVLWNVSGFRFGFGGDWNVAFLFLRSKIWEVKNLEIWDRLVQLAKNWSVVVWEKVVWTYCAGAL